MPKYFYKLNICYNGNDYFGFQSQKGSVRTIQEDLEIALRKINQGKEVQSLGSGRTDAKVHAIGQVVKVEISFDIPEGDLKNALNGLLSEQIRVLSVARTNETFHPVFQATSKEYIYLFSEQELNPFNAEFIVQAPHNLQYDKIKEAMKLLVGDHDFVNYMCVGTPVKSSVRTIFDCSLSLNTDFEFNGVVFKNIHQFHFHGSGFLKQMIRLLVGALWNVGHGRVSLENFKDSLKNPVSHKLGSVAPGQGLYLKAVHYPPDV